MCADKSVRATCVDATSVVQTLLFVQYLAVFLSIYIILHSCTNPTTTTNPTLQASVNGAYILSEGLHRQDNSTLARFDAASGIVVNDIVPLANAGLRLGDTANDMVMRGDTLYVAVATSRAIEIFRVSTGTWLGRIRFSENRQEPRNIAILNDTSAFVTLFNDDSVQEFNPRTFALKGSTIKVGPTPEGIAAVQSTTFGSILVVANSGFGDFRAKEAKAGTLSVVNAQTRREIKVLENLPNAREVLLSPDRTRFYATFTNLYSQPDSLGGIVEYDAASLTERRRWRIKEPLSTCIRNDSLFCVSARGVEVCALKQVNAGFRVLFPAEERNIWYSLALHPTSGAVWIGNARNNQVDGEVSIRAVSGAVLKRFDVGINPNTIVFF